MPLYEYTCEACGAHVEKLQNRGAAAPEECPKCSGKGTLHRGISKTSFHLKGGGWYVTDYAGAKDSGSGSSAPEEASPTESAAESAAESTADTSSASETPSASSSGSGDDSAA